MHKQKQTNVIIYGGIMLSLTATAKEMREAKAWLATHTAVIVWSERKKSTVYIGFLM
jgi:hypothetical protein